MSTALTVVQDETGFSQSQIDIIRSQVAPQGTSNDELRLFLMYCQRSGLDPFSRQIYLSERGSMVDGKWTITRKPETTIDGFRLIAERTGQYAGQLGPFWCGKDGQWVDVWLEDSPPSAARVGVLRNDFKEPLYGIALWKEYAQKKKDGSMTSMWANKGVLMLAKCAESIALRRAFPRELSGMYTGDEMSQASNGHDSEVPQAPAKSHYGDSGSAEQAADVAKERIASLGGNPELVQPKAPKATRTKKSTVDEPKRDVPKPDAEKLRLITAFQDIKKALHGYDVTDAVYYQTLESHGARHCDEFDTETARQVYRKLQSSLIGLKSAAAHRTEIQDIRDAVEHDVFWRVLNGLGIEDDDTLDGTSGDALYRVLEALREVIAKPAAVQATGPDKSDWLPGNVNLAEPAYMKEVRTVAAQMAAAKGAGRFRDIMGENGAESLEDVPNAASALLIVQQAKQWLVDHPNKPTFGVPPKGAA